MPPPTAFNCQPPAGHHPALCSHELLAGEGLGLRGLGRGHGCRHGCHLGLSMLGKRQRPACRCAVCHVAVLVKEVLEPVLQRSLHPGAQHRSSRFSDPIHLWLTPALSESHVARRKIVTILSSACAAVAPRMACRSPFAAKVSRCTRSADGGPYKAIKRLGTGGLRFKVCSAVQFEGTSASMTRHPPSASPRPPACGPPFPPAPPPRPPITPPLPKARPQQAAVCQRASPATSVVTCALSNPIPPPQKKPTRPQQAAV